MEFSKDQLNKLRQIEPIYGNTALDLLRKIDILDDEVLQIANQKRVLLSQLNEAKTQIMIDHVHLIGRKAICQPSDSPKKIECTCTSVHVLSDYSGVEPLFSLGNKKISVDEYSWI